MVTIHKVALQDETLFVALSYVWGDPTDTVEIIANGAPRQGDKEPFRGSQARRKPRNSPHGPKIRRELQAASLPAMGRRYLHRPGEC